MRHLTPYTSYALQVVLDMFLSRLQHEIGRTSRSSSEASQVVQGKDSRSTSIEAALNSMV